MALWQRPSEDTRVERETSPAEGGIGFGQHELSKDARHSHTEAMCEPAVVTMSFEAYGSPAQQAHQGPSGTYESSARQDTHMFKAFFSVLDSTRARFAGFKEAIRQEHTRLQREGEKIQSSRRSV